MPKTNFKIVSKVREQVTTETYEIRLNGVRYVYIDYLNDKEKVIDSVLRDSEGVDPCDPALLEEIESLIDRAETALQQLRT